MKVNIDLEASADRTATPKLGYVKVNYLDTLSAAKFVNVDLTAATDNIENTSGKFELAKGEYNKVFDTKDQFNENGKSDGHLVVIDAGLILSRKRNA